MGRYAAPQFDLDHVDDGQPMPMDWDAISEDDDVAFVDKRQGSNILNEGEPQSLVCCNGNDATKKNITMPTTVLPIMRISYEWQSINII